MKLLQELTLQSSYEEVEKVEGLLTAIQQELGIDNELYAKLMLAVSEAVTNSIIHGNKLDESKKVTLKAFLNPQASKLVFETKDEGKGFNPEEIPDPLADENLLKTSGRGVFLMEEYADEVSYSEGGTKLRLIFELPENSA
ncbi:MAG: ATP-binding protein [Balneolaceae bacterium]